MRRRLGTCLVPALAALSVGCAGTPRNGWTPGLELQAYPAGLQATAVAARAISEDELLTLRAGYNATDRRDFGEQDDEEGGGPGLGLGWHHLFEPAGDGWIAGARLDLWWLDIDWKDDSGEGGSTDVVVLQPTAEGGYRWLRGDGSSLALTLSLGLEVNVDTDGEDVGEGAIALLGLRYLF